MRALVAVPLAVVLLVVEAAAPAGSLVALSNTPSPSSPAASPPPPLCVLSADKSTKVEVSPNTGRIVAVQDVAVLGQTMLPCQPVGPPTVHQDAGGGPVVVERRLVCDASSGPGVSGSHPVRLVETLAQAASSVAWRTVITADGPAGSSPFSVPITTGLWNINANRTAGYQYWTTWGKGCVQNDGPNHGSCFSQGAWQDPLDPTSFPTGSTTTTYRLGEIGHTDERGPSRDRAMLDVLLTVDEAGVGFQRVFLRLGVGHPVATTAHILGRPSTDWRPAIAGLAELYPSFFHPPNPGVRDFEGLGGYSSNLAPYNASYAQSVGFRVNWDLSGTFMPYDGLFLPYQPVWENLGPINQGLAKYNVTPDLIERHYKAVLAAGFKSLSYYDVGNWGTSIKLPPTKPGLACGKRPNGQPAPCPTPEGSSAFLEDELREALLMRMYRVGEFHTGPERDWVGTTDMDPADPVFQDLIVEQLQRHLDLIPSFEGIAIDRLDYTTFYNLDADDNVSWVPRPEGKAWNASRSLYLSHRDVFARLGELLHSRSKVMLMNCNSLCRIDLLEPFDGLFSEGSCLNGNAFSTFLRPGILWTYSLDAHSASELDGFFQQHLLMSVFPMAPMAKNDHSIVPGNATIEAWYQKYAPLFGAMRGTRWHLVAHPARLVSTQHHASVNALVHNETSALVVMVMLGEPGATGMLVEVRDPPGMQSPSDRYRMQVLHPGKAGWQPLPDMVLAGGVANVTLHLSQDEGCAVVRGDRVAPGT